MNYNTPHSATHKGNPAGFRTPQSTELAGLLEGYREEIVAAWVRMLAGVPGSRFAALPVIELQTSLRDQLLDMALVFRRGEYADLEAHLAHTCAIRVTQGFDISEVIQGSLLLKDAVLPVIWREAQWEADTALRLLAELDGVLHWIVIQVSKLYSLQLNRRLAEQVELLTHSQAQLQAQNARLAEQSEQLERRVREVVALNRSSALITSTLDLNKVMDLILEQLAEVVRYDSATIMWRIAGVLRIIACRGFGDPATVLGARFDPEQNPLTRRLMSEASPIVIADVHREPSFDHQRGHLTRSWIGVPLRVRDETIGALTIDHRQISSYDAEDGQTVMAFANQAAIALENASLYDRSRELAVLEERNRLARELHDSISQMLFSMVLNAEAAATLYDSNPESARVQIARLQETSHTALKEMRTLIFELRPANLEEEGLVPVLKKHIALFKERNGIDVHLDAEGQRRWPFAMEKALYRVAQEALTNVAKHAGATTALVSLGAADGWVSLTVEDNGRGLPPDRAGRGQSTLGLTSMRERAEQLGGRFTIGPGPDGKGTRVQVALPYA
ncbi:MAG TPA: histidine kinase [Chloroflexia bacterium]|nr:histidine kinase [Chloroflexia bacterium]